MEVNSQVIVAISGAILSLLFSYIPGLRVWYASLISEKKQLIMLGLLVLVTGGIFALGCFDILKTGIECSKQGVVDLVLMLIAGVVANQATYLISPATNDAVVAKQLRDDGALG